MRTYRLLAPHFQLYIYHTYICFTLQDGVPNNRVSSILFLISLTGLMDVHSFLLELQDLFFESYILSPSFSFSICICSIVYLLLVQIVFCFISFTIMMLKFSPLPRGISYLSKQHEVQGNSQTIQQEKRILVFNTLVKIVKVKGVYGAYHKTKRHFLSILISEKTIERRQRNQKSVNLTCLIDRVPSSNGPLSPLAPLRD